VPLLNPVPEPKYWRAYLRGLKEMVEIDRAPAGLPESPPQRLYVITLKDIADGKGVEAIKPGAWRFYLGSFEGPAVALTVGESDGGGPPKMTSMTHGHFVQRVFQEVREVAALPQVKARDYELRRLKIPGVLGAFWLRSPTDPSGESDLVVPYHLLVRDVKRMKAYSVKTLCELLWSFAEERQQVDDAPRPPRKPRKQPPQQRKRR
jgi:hypothetical protein